MADFYGTTSDAATYHTARGKSAAWTAVSDKAAALYVASAYIDTLIKSSLGGYKTGGRDQLRELPRIGATDAEGLAIDSDEVPVEAEYATYEAALIEGTTPGTLFPNLAAGAPILKRAKADTVEVEFALMGGSKATFPAVRAALAGLVRVDTSNTIQLIRG